MTRRILLALVSAMALSQAACGGDNTTTKHGDNMKIRLRIGNRALTGTLIASKTAQDFVLPVAFNADDERSVRQGKVRSPAASDLD